MTAELQLYLAIAVFGLLWLTYFWWRRGMPRRKSRFTGDAEQAISFARVEAEKLQSPTIEPTHLLLGLLHVTTPVIGRLLPPDSHTSIREEIQQHVAGGAIVSYRDDLPYSEEAQKALVATAREARALGAEQIGAEHLLLGLLHSETSLAALILRERGLRLEPLREALGGPTESPQP